MPDELDSQKQDFKTLVDDSPDIIARFDKDLRYVYVNKTAETVIGLPAASFIGKTSKDLTPLKAQEEYWSKNIAQVFQTRKETVIELHFDTPSLGKRYFQARIVPEFFPDGSIPYVLSVAYDITELKQYEDVLKKRTEELEAARARDKVIDEIKTEIISLTSHELRTPLSAMRGYISMIQDGDYGPMNPGLKKPLGMVAESTDRLIHIVNEMLDVSRIEAGKLVFNLAELHIQDLIKEVVATLQPLADKKQVKLVVKESQDLIVQADKDKIIQVLNNLIGNSLKFTDAGSVTMTVDQKDGMIIVYVTDTGIGIAKEDHSKLFGKFDEIKLKQAGKTAGTGLGLYISHELVKKLGGDMWVEFSEPGKGSTFAFSLPEATSEHARRIKEGLQGDVK